MPTLEEYLAQGYTLSDDSITEPVQQEEPSYWSLNYGGETPTVADDILGYGGAYLKGIGKGLATVPELAALGGNTVLNLVGFDDPIPYPSTYINAGVDKFTGREGVEPSSGEIFLDYVGGGVGSVQGGLSLLKAASGLDKASKTARTLNTIGAFQSAGPQAQLIGSAGAGLGAVVADEVVPESNFAKIAFPIAGALLPAATTTGINFIRRGAQSLDPAVVDDIARQQAISEIGDYVDVESLPKRIKEAKSALATDPYASFKTSAEVLNDPGLGRLQDVTGTKSLELTNAINDLAASRNIARNDAVLKVVDNALDSGESVATIRKVLEKNVEAADELVKKYANEAFHPDTRIKTTPIKAAITSKINEITKSGANKLSSDFNALADNFRALDKNVDFQTLQDYRSSFGDFLKPGPNADRVAKQTARAAGTIRQVMDKMIDKAVETGEMSTAQRKAFDKMKAARIIKGDLYEKGATSQALKKDAFTSSYELPGEKVLGKALQTKEEVQRTIKALGAKGADTFRKAAVNELFEKSLNSSTDKLRPSTYIKELKKLQTRGVLTPAQSKALAIVADDLKSEIRGAKLRAPLSGGISPTAERLTPLKAISKTLGLAVRGKASLMFMRKVPGLDSLYEAFDKVRNIPGIKERIMNEAILSVDGLEKLIQPGFEGKEKIKVMKDAVNIMKGAIAGIVNEEKGGSNPEQMQKEMVDATPAPTPTPTPAAPSALTLKDYLDKGYKLVVDTTLPAEAEAQAPIPRKNTAQIGRENVKAMLKNEHPLFTAIAQVESNFNPRAVSPDAGAQGLFQIMPANSRKLGISDPFDPEQSLQAAKLLMDEEVRRYKDIRLALAAYNAGSPAVNSAIKKARSRNFSEVARYLPEETRSYVPKVLNAYNAIGG